MWPQPDSYWPFWSPRVLNRRAFIWAFLGFGYFKCENSRTERWFEKVALYELNGEPKHMARQLADGTWTSKCGGAEDITHFTLDALESYGPHPFKAEYGEAVVYMKRFIPVAWVVRRIQRLLVANRVSCTMITRRSYYAESLLPRFCTGTAKCLTQRYLYRTHGILARNQLIPRSTVSGRSDARPYRIDPHPSAGCPRHLFGCCSDTLAHPGTGINGTAQPKHRYH